tara:strand:+ start:780 stop:1610 length:831 start_codon:yes stop_codon:yes gene_type:complete
MIIWLSSYPKSGNTLLRGILATYLFSNDGIFSFENLYKINQFPTIKNFENIGIKSNEDEKILKNYVKAQELINNKVNKIIFFKTHSANFKIKESTFTDINNSKGAIYIVRDPRNVVSSLAYHNQISINEATEFMKKNSWLIKNNKIPDTFVGSWKFNYNSWKNLNKKVLIIRYEDLLKDKKKTVIKVLEFLNHLKINIIFDDKKLNKTIETTEFENMKKLEKTSGFDESVVNKKTGEFKPFFNLGPKNNWDKSLETKNIKIIEEEFSSEMKELGYL